MEIQQDLKVRIFKVFERELLLQEFEKWLYENEELSDSLDIDINLALCSFNYKQKDALYQFRAQFFKYFSESEFVLWKVKSNLISIISGTSPENRERILYSFIDLDFDKYYEIRSIGYFLDALDYCGYMGSCEEVEKDLKTKAMDLYLRISVEEHKVSDFEISKFPYFKQSIIELDGEKTKSIVEKKWWQIWK